MATNDFAGEVPVNDEQKCPCVLVLDTSGSMSGEPINELNNGLSRFHEEISKDTTASSRLEIEIIRFDSSVEVVQGFSLVENFSMPQLSTRGSTKLVDGVRKGIERVDERKKWYKEEMQTYYRPYIILITDGAPDDGQDVDGLSREIQNGVDGKHFNFWAFGVEGANMEVLQKISHASFAPLKLTGVDFVKFFQWLSTSMTAVTNSKEGEKIDIAPKSNYENPFQITV
jgi:uncharacterized protein YegL